jgi:glycosyltransferase involved in cell wall biosynthesis
MKIGIFLPNATFDLPGSPEVGGIETFSFTVGEAWQQLGHEVVLFGGDPKPGRRHRATTLRLRLLPYLETKSIPDVGTRFQRLVQRLHFAWQARQAWREEGCDVLILAKPFDWPVAWWWKKSRPKLQVIMGFHGTDFFAGDTVFYSAIDAAFAVSPAVAKLAEKRVGRKPTLIPNPVDLAFFSPGEPRPIDPQAEWHLVSSGRLVGWKGFDLLIEAVARLRKEHRIPCRLSLAGDGPDRADLAARAAALGISSAVNFCGLLDQSELRALLRSGDLYVLPSLGLEAFSIAALEAAAVGLPLALSDQVGLKSYLTPEDAAVFPSRNGEALVALLVGLFERRTDPVWTDRAARHARLESQFSPRLAAENILALLPRRDDSPLRSR